MKGNGDMTIRELARATRRDVLEMGFRCGGAGAHFGGSLSLVEIISVLFGEVFRVHGVVRDRFVFSKGHGVMTQYAVMKNLGLLNSEQLETFKKDGSPIAAHPSMNAELGIDFSSGSLGQGLSLGVGSALGLRRKGDVDTRVYVLLGDGECDEGSVWEAAMSASRFGLDNLIAIVDRNRLQYDGDTEDVMPLGDFASKWNAFGWAVIECDGHDMSALSIAFKAEHRCRPLVVIADTIKGKGVSFMERQASWHNGVLTKSLYEQAIKELEVVGA